MRTLSLITAATLAFGVGSTAMAADNHGHGMGHSMQGKQTAGQEAVSGTGVVRAIQADAVTLAHDPIPALKWPAMVMGFKLQDPALAQGLKVGDAVEFELVPAKGGYAISAIGPKL